MNLGEGQRWGPITYAQHGDDLFIINLFELMGIYKPSWLDIGANHPIAISNTALLYSRGSRGVNVEANPELMAEFLLHRPEDININVGVAPQAGQLEFFMFRDGNGLNTFSPAERDKTIASGNPVARTKMIDMITINDVVNKFCDGRWPHLLSIDVEGLDFEILKTAQIPRYNGPIIICVETRRHESKRMQNIVCAHGYKLAARLAENLIFVREDYFGIGY